MRMKATRLITKLISGDNVLQKCCEMKNKLTFFLISLTKFYFTLTVPEILALPGKLSSMHIVIYKRIVTPTFIPFIQEQLAHRCMLKSATFKLACFNCNCYRCYPSNQ